VLEDVHGRLRDILGELGEAGGHAQDRPAQDRPAQDRPAEPGRHGEQGQLGARRW
jgi:hypothetical protein